MNDAEPSLRVDDPELAARIANELRLYWARERVLYQQEYAERLAREAYERGRYEARQRQYSQRAYGWKDAPTVPLKDAWSVLGLPHSATRAQLNRRHRQLSREHRDDNAKLVQINQAYNELKGAIQ